MRCIVQRLKDFEAGKSASLEVLAHAKKMQAFAEKIIEHPEIKSYLSVNKDIKLADRGGFIKIRERFQKGEWLDEDIYLLIKKLQNKAMSKSHMRAQSKSQDGRRR